MQLWDLPNSRHFLVAFNIIFLVLKADQSHRSHVFTFLVLPLSVMVSLPREGSSSNTPTVVHKIGFVIARLPEIGLFFFYYCPTIIKYIVISA